MKLILKLLAPYFAVIVFWNVFQNAWLSIIAYHAQILFWSHKDLKKEPLVLDRLSFLIVAPSIFSGLTVYFLLPYIAKTDIDIWLSLYKLDGVAFLIMIPYFGILHPFLEQKYWRRLREDTKIAHIAFSGYHALVLSTFLKIEWVFICLGVLLSVSVFWKFVTSKQSSCSACVFSHIFADLGMIVAAYLSI